MKYGRQSTFFPSNIYDLNNFTYEHKVKTLRRKARSYPGRE